MEIIAASICGRGYVEDEVAGVLEMAPRIGYRWMEIHGPMAWSVEALEAFDLPRVQAAILTIELEVEDPENLPRYMYEAYVYVSGLLGMKL